MFHNRTYLPIRHGLPPTWSAEEAADGWLTMLQTSGSRIQLPVRTHEMAAMPCTTGMIVALHIPSGRLLLRGEGESISYVLYSS